MQTIMTSLGGLEPQHTTDDLRKKEILPVILHDNGTPRSVPLENQTVVETPVGPIPAELVTFHENSVLNRIFPLNGKLSAYWSEADEATLAKPSTINTPVGPLTARIISISFYNTGKLRSLTLWPGETISVETPLGLVQTRIGVSFSPEGELRSLEPARPTTILTPAGEVVAYDSDAVGLNGDNNSLVFSEKGEVCCFTTIATTIKTIQQNGSTTLYKPSRRESLCGDSDTEPSPMRVEFSDTSMSISLSPHEPPTRMPLNSTLCFTDPPKPEGFAIPPMGSCAP